MTVEFGLENRVILITGGGAVGTATGVEAARIGAKVALFEFSEEALARSTAAIEEAGGTVRGYTVDVRDSDALDSAIDKVESELGPIYGVVPTAGITRPAPADQMSMKDWADTLDLNLTGSFLTAQLAARRMLPRQSGAIVFISSILGIGGLAGRAAYSATKWGVIGMAKCMAIDWGPSGIRVNTVCPSPIEGPMLRAVYSQEGLEQQFLSRNPLGRLSDPAEQARAVLFLLSDWASYINGAVLPVDGGMSAGYLNDIQRVKGEDGEVRVSTVRQ